MTQGVPVATAFVAGLLSFFAPCVLPLIPSFFAWSVGDSKSRIFQRTLFLVVGFSVFFVILGASASKLGQWLISYRLPVQQIGGALIILFGLEFIGALKVIKRLKTGLVESLFSKVNSRASSFIIGGIMSFAWIACISPILGSILVFSAFQETLGKGVFLLGVYSLGLAIPFLVVSLFVDLVEAKTEIITRASKVINIFSGAILVILGFLLVSDNYYRLVIWLNQIYGRSS